MAGILILVCWVLLVVYWNISARSVKSAVEPQSFAARLARLPVWLGFVLFIAAWAHPFSIVAIRRTLFSDSMGVAICALGLFVAICSRKALGAEWSQDVDLKQGHKLVQGGPYQFYAPSHLHRPSAHGPGNCYCLRFTDCVCGARFVRGGFLDKTEPGGKPTSAQLSR